jgi:AraC family ethanolamine operon transcriptional activator
MLKVAPASAKVSDIANAWGFWHMGDFAQKYRTFFGLNPLEQLRISS